MITIATCVPKQTRTLEQKLEWLEGAIDQTKPDLFVAPQEYFGGHYVMPNELHIPKQWILDEVGALAKRKKTAISVGAATLHDSGGATQDYFYFGPSGTFRGFHRKFAHPGYDDVRANGAGRLWPETSYATRVKPVEIPQLGLTIGTVFCWEVFTQTLFGAYSFGRSNLIAHPIKFAPRGWPKTEKKKGEKHIKGFGVVNKGLDLWKDKLIMASRHEALCPIAVSCNSWGLGKNYFALHGHVDEIMETTALHEVECLDGAAGTSTFEINPALYTGLDMHFSMGQFKEHVGSLEHFHKLDAWTMHMKIRRLEAQLIGGTTYLDCRLKAATGSRQKKSTFKRANKRV